MVFLRSVLEPHWSEEASMRHPLWRPLNASYFPNDQWLQELARKILAASEIEGSASIIKRLANAAEYPGAFAELETAMALGLEGRDVSFIERSKTRSADIMIRETSGNIQVEVSTLNQSRREQQAMGMLTMIASKGTRQKLMHGGVVNAAYISEEKIARLEAAIDEATIQAIEGHKVAQACISGFANLYFAPADLVKEIPEGMGGHVRFNMPNGRTPEEKINEKIQAKSKQLLARGEASILVLYDELFLGGEQVKKFFNDKMDGVTVILNSVPHIGGLVLSSRLGILEPINDFERKDEPHKVLFGSEVGAEEPRCFLCWTNAISPRPMPEWFVGALERYGTNLVRLPALK